MYEGQLPNSQWGRSHATHTVIWHFVLLLSLQQSLRSVEDDDFCLCKDNTSAVADFRY